MRIERILLITLGLPVCLVGVLFILLGYWFRAGKEFAIVMIEIMDIE